MQTFLLVMLTLNVQTGAIVKATTIGDPYPSLDDCQLGAIQRGPQAAFGQNAQMLVCRSSDERKDVGDSVAPEASAL